MADTLYQCLRLKHGHCETQAELRTDVSITLLLLLLLRKNLTTIFGTYDVRRKDIRHLPFVVGSTEITSTFEEPLMATTSPIRTLLDGEVTGRQFTITSPFLTRPTSLDRLIPKPADPTASKRIDASTAFTSFTEGGRTARSASSRGLTVTGTSDTWLRARHAGTISDATTACAPRSPNRTISPIRSA